MKLPKHIIDDLKLNKTSLGNHPSFPPEEEDCFLVKIIGEFYDKYTNDNEANDEQTLSKLMSECKKIESENLEALNELCIKVINDLFEIPEDTLKIDTEIVDKIDNDKERLIPEKTVDFSFDSIEDMKNLTDEVYKRRLLNALVSGAAIYYSSNFEFYIKDLFKINPKLPLLYKSIHDINTILLYERKNISTKNSGGCVEVYISNGENQVNINAKGLFLPTLLEETIKGILELAISHGLPKDRKKAQYIIGKSDFKLADIWDMRIGLPLWLVIKDLCDELGYDPIKIGVNFIFMELSTLEPPKFNNVMSEIFGKTNKGKNILKNLLQYIEKEKQNDEFDDYVSNKNNDYQINDGVYYTVDELKNDIF